MYAVLPFLIVNVVSSRPGAPTAAATCAGVNYRAPPLERPRHSSRSQPRRISRRGWGGAGIRISFL